MTPLLIPSIPSPAARPGSSVVIVGGGFAGVAIAIGLLKSMEGGRVLLVEKGVSVARGAAYGSQDPDHLLNVRAKNMSVDSDRPGDFVDWLKQNGENYVDIEERFVPRVRYGQYLEARLAAAIDRSSCGFVWVQDEAVDIGPGLSVHLRSGDRVRGEFLVLALGNLPPSLPAPFAALASDPRIIVNPWLPKALGPIGRKDHVLIVGSGLTMVDTVVSLHRSGFTGKIRVRSRHGLVPYVHAPSRAINVNISPEKDVIRQVIDLINQSGESWRDTVDALRPQTVELWQSLSWKQRRMFRKRLQIHWDQRRHRIPEVVGEELADLQKSGRLDIAAGQIASVDGSEDRIAVRIHSYAGGQELFVDRIINCTGASCDLKGAKLPLLESVVEAGLAEYDPLGIGLMVDDDGQTGPQTNVWALGPMCRGCRLETTAVPEIRVQAKRVAEAIVARARAPVMT